MRRSCISASYQHLDNVRHPDLEPAAEEPQQCLVAECLGINAPAADDFVHDLLIIGAGPAGLAAAVYTQTTDVEIEVNGLMTYDRKVMKFDTVKLSEMHKRLIQSVTQ